MTKATNTPLPSWVREIQPDWSGKPPDLPDEPSRPRRKPERPNNQLLIVIAGLLIGSTLVRIIVNRLPKEP